MNHRFLLCRSQSEAIAVNRQLGACGVSGRLARPPRSEQVRSCAWAVAVSPGDAMRAEQCLRGSSIPRNTWQWEAGT